jgi:dihydrofolate reductase
MGKLIVSEFVTVDGVVEDPGGSEDWDLGGWAFEFERGDVGDRFKLDEVMAADALLLGRTTYEGFAAAWPEREGDFADKFNGMRKYAVSSTLTDPQWSNTEVLGADLEAEVGRIKGEHDGDILINGSVSLVGALSGTGLIDEYRLMVFPTVLGAGKQLFGAASRKENLKLVDARPAGETTILIYETV